jgi:hypothetical protein
MAATPCNVLNTVSQFQLDAMTQLNKKLMSLQNTAQLLERNGDSAASFVTQLNNSTDSLARITDVDKDLYDKLVAACPFLTNPIIGPDDTSASAASSVESLQATVMKSYDSLINKLLNHPYRRMQNLQGEMDNTINQFAAKNILATNFTRCMQQACSSILFSDLAPDNLKEQADRYQRNFINGTARVLSQAQQDKADLVTSLVGHIQGLGATPRKTYSTAKAALTALQTV